MYNKYLTEDDGRFKELYRAVERDDLYENGQSCEPVEKRKKQEERQGFDLKRLLHGLDVEKLGILPLALLLLLILDVDDEEKLIIIALAVIIGI